VSPAGRDRSRGFIRRPTADELIDVGRREFLSLGRAEAELYAEIVGGILGQLDTLDALDVPAAVPSHARVRDLGGPPAAADNPHNTFLHRCRIEGSGTGPLAGMRAAVKDNIAVARVPTTNGARLTAHAPTADAVVVERLLDAGADLVGKLNMDDFGSGGTGETSAFGPARNPLDPARSPGGSSGGTGAAVAAGEVEVGLAVDQGGSGRVPASFCGVVALKATQGLIPSHGVTHMDHTLDCVSPTAKTVALCATIADVVSGHDDRDPQWVRAAPEPTRCADALGLGVEGLRIGIVPQASGADRCEPAVLRGLDAAAGALTAAGAEIVEAPIALWTDSWPIGLALWIQLGWAMVQSEGQGYGHLGEVDESAVRAFALSRRHEADELPPFMKVWLLAGRYLHERYLSQYLARAQNLRRELRRQVTAAFGGCDLLLMPTTTMVAPELLTGPAADDEIMDRAFTGANTAPLNVSGHPALAVPSGIDEDSGMPTSVQLVAPHFEDARTFRAGAVIEASR